MKRGFTLIEIIVVAAIVAILLPVFQHPHGGMYQRDQCHSSLRRLALGTSMYAQDYDDNYPRAVAGDPVTGWADAIAEYVGNRRDFQCPAERTPHPVPGARNDVYTDYWMNRRLSAAPARAIRHPARTILFGDGNEGAATYVHNAIASLPDGWISDAKSPLSRHMYGANYAFADGHVKWFAASEIGTLNPSALPKSAGIPSPGVGFGISVGSRATCKFRIAPK